MLKNIVQGDPIWNTERSFRISGSKCYSLYTFNSCNIEDWTKKIRSLYFNSFAGNEATRYGLSHENVAREKYMKDTGTNVVEVGLVILPQLPWLAFSPDGIVFQHGKPSHLLEIKCPLLAVTSSFQDLITSKKKNFLTGDNHNGYQLKKKNPYYGQIQLGLALLNMEMCHLYVYSKHESALIIQVKKDNEFINDMLENLRKKYFLYILPLFVEMFNKNM
ncbi:uncharacterized protein LOC111620309 [Centruroides sculpturatus]|uniref:uncharacterized protein LOC111620309 n=1 Tax=Centruroides sculpturatus TaxID=218467 RepID=UPI000C6CC4A3|nr:uncharacterized protein LOC111620309 [Centruroides sculpturatus]